MRHWCRLVFCDGCWLKHLCLAWASQIYLDMQGESSNETFAGLSLQTGERRNIVERLPKLLQSSLSSLRAINVSAPWKVRAAAAAKAEDLLREWSREALYQGLPLVDLRSPELWQLLDRMLLPHSVSLCMPKLFWLGIVCSSWPLRGKTLFKIMGPG